MRPEEARVQTDTVDPFRDQPSIVPRGHGLDTTTARKKELSRLLPRALEVCVYGFAGLLSQLELDRYAGLSLTDRCAVDSMTVRSNIFDPQFTTSQPRSLLSIARLNIARSRVRPSICRFDRIDQTCFSRSGGLAPVSLPLFHGMWYSCRLGGASSRRS
jgi:hypothetical protein